MDPIVQVLIDRIEALAVDKAGLKAQLAGMRQDVQSAERQADERGQTIQELRCTNTILVSALTAIGGAISGPHEALVETIRQAVREVSLRGQPEAR